jgi:hypothetical protein
MLFCSLAPFPALPASTAVIYHEIARTAVCSPFSAFTSARTSESGLSALFQPFDISLMCGAVERLSKVAAQDEAAGEIPSSALTGNYAEHEQG